jgi:signal peptidase I
MSDETTPTPLRGQLAEWVVTLLMLVFAITTLVQSFVIPSGSMEDSLLIGDHVFVDKLAYAPAGSVSKHFLPYSEIQRGDVIVFRYPLDLRQNYVKRVIGLPGDHIRLHHKQLIRNGKPVEEPYVVHKTDFFDPYRDDFPSAPPDRLPLRARTMLEQNVQGDELVVPPGCYFAMGDNRDNSEDSRYWGFVPRENIIGKPLMIYWSFDPGSDDLAAPMSFEHVVNVVVNFFGKTRWSRTFRLIRASAPTGTAALSRP